MSQTQSDAQRLFNIFPGSDLAFGRTTVGDNTNAKGKTDSKSWLIHRPVTVDDFQSHIEGSEGIGLPPINSENKVRWGAIDVDVYQGIDLKKLQTQITENTLPLVLCRSKSGGPHIFLFVREWIDAAVMISMMQSFAGFLGFGDSEIFPKQAKLLRNEGSQDFGSWINLPYFGGTVNMRYAHDEQGAAITTIMEFEAFVKSRQIMPNEMPDLIAPKGKESDSVLPDGPPCLNRILAKPVTENRNEILSNLCVYAKKRWPDEWETKVVEVNNKFDPPLPKREVDNLVKSYKKTDYRYKCSREPLCRHCDASACKKAKYGIEGSEDEKMPDSRSLTMIATDPPIWYLSINIGVDDSARISLTTEELQTPRLYQRRCMEELQVMPPIPKGPEWQERITSLMKNCTVVEIPKGMSPTDQFIEVLKQFLESRSEEPVIEDILRGMPFLGDEGWSFRMSDVTQFLQNQRFTLLKYREYAEILRGLGATSKRRHIGTQFISVFTMPPIKEDI
tara:strand:+ start:2733 stop:4247 length:1515 start_codon:yes stop_codon:yes gene_type:complete